MSKYISRRQLLRNLIVGIGGITLAACGPKTEIVEKEVTRVVKETVEVEKEVEKEVTKVVSEEKVVEKVVTATPAPSKVINDLGIELPDDAAPNDQQYIYSEGGDLAGFLEFFKSSFYQGGSGGAFCPVVQASLMRLNEDGQAIPEAAEEYPTVSSDGLTWTFKIRKGMEWSDGHPLTAQDWLFTFRRGADPATGFDFGWFYADITNWNEVNQGDLPPEELGVEAPDDYTLLIHTNTPVPYIPMIMTHSFVSPKHVVEELGDDWSTRFETLVFSGPFILQDWKKGRYYIYAANPHYKGPFHPNINRLVTKVTQAGAAGAATATIQEAYANGELENYANVPRAQLPAILADPKLSTWVSSYPDFQTYYFMMESTTPPFDNVKVRQALAKSIDRELICNTTLKGFAEPAWEMLPRGFPAYSPEHRKHQDLDIPAAKQLLADAGYPDGKGFPKLELWVRNEGGRIESMKPLAEFAQAQWKTNLGIDVDIKIIEMKVWIEARTARSHPFMLGSYMYDYIDPSNMLNFLKSGGHGFFVDPKFDELLEKANTNVFDPEERIRQYQEAEDYLCEQAGVVFLTHDVINQIIPPYFSGKSLEPNKDNIRAWRGVRLGTTEFTVYLNQTIAEHPRPNANVK
jgi:ABC-type transport system substrate-binding protein